MMALWNDSEGQFASELLEAIVAEDARVLVVGPGLREYPAVEEWSEMTLPQDAGLMFFLEYCLNGSVTVFDLPAEYVVTHDYHGLPRIRAYVDYLVEQGARLAPCEFIEGDIFDEQLSRGQFDIINDHFTWDFAVPMKGTRAMFHDRPERYLALAGQYHNLLVDGGKALLYFHLGHHLYLPDLMAAFTGAGFTIADVCFNLCDEYEMKDAVLRADLEERASDWRIYRDGRLLPDYKAYGLIIAEK